jgi:DNA-binding NtrC family response regulator
MATERILILDDEPDTARIWVRLLESAGYHCLATTEPEEALRLLQSERPDVLLTDLRMPGLDGMDMLRRARQIDPQIPVVVLTGHASLESAVAAVKAGAFDFLSKSFSNEQLRLTVERALTKRRLELEVLHLREQLRGVFGFENIVGRSAALQQVLD